MKNIEKQLIKSAKQLPSMQKEIVFSKETMNNFDKIFSNILK